MQLTILATDNSPGLQLFLDNQWCDVPPMSDAFVINLGDLLERCVIPGTFWETPQPRLSGFTTSCSNSQGHCLFGIMTSRHCSERGGGTLVDASGTGSCESTCYVDVAPLMVLFLHTTPFLRQFIRKGRSQGSFLRDVGPFLVLSRRCRIGTLGAPL